MDRILISDVRTRCIAGVRERERRKSAGHEGQSAYCSMYVSHSRDGAVGLQEAVMRVQVDRELCIGAGVCVVIAPTYFVLDEQGLALVTRAEVAPGDEELVRQAEAGCPVEAILVEP